MPWTTLATLVVINHDEGGHLQRNSMLSTPFNAPLEWCSAHSARARVGLRGHLSVQKWSKMILSKVVPRQLGGIKQVVYGHFEPSWTHIPHGSSKMALKWAIVGLMVGMTVQQRRVRGNAGGGLIGEGC